MTLEVTATAADRYIGKQSGQMRMCERDREKNGGGHGFVSSSNLFTQMVRLQIIHVR